jgi:uncharacterized phage protein (TIGR01671 family)
MNREIKFRAWDENLKMMHSNVSPWRWDFVISNSWHRCEKSTGTGILGSGGDTAEMLVPAVRFTHLMQFTGLHDKNGKEIYEGDIVVLREAERTYIVKYHKGCFKLFHTDPKLNDLVWGTIERVEELLWTIEIIGNIYENPDLIK